MHPIVTAELTAQHRNALLAQSERNRRASVARQAVRRLRAVRSLSGVRPAPAQAPAPALKLTGPNAPAAA